MKLRLAIVVAITTFTSTCLFGQMEYWWGNEPRGCTFGAPNDASIHDPDRWRGGGVPNESFIAAFDELEVSFWPAGNIHFGEYDVELTGSGDHCASKTVPGGDFNVGGLSVSGLEMNFFLEGHSLATVFNGITSSALGGGRATLRFDGPGDIFTQNVVALGRANVTLTDEIAVSAAALVADEDSHLSLDGPITVEAIRVLSLRSSVVDILGGAQVTLLGSPTDQAIKVSSTNFLIPAELNISGSTTRVVSAGQIGIANDNTTSFQDFGLVTISDGGFLSTGQLGSPSFSSGIVGQRQGMGRMIVTDPGSVWTQDGFLNVGLLTGANGELEIQNGGLVESSDGRIARDLGSTGLVRIVGADSEWNATGSIFVGGGELSPGGDGTISLEGGAISVGDDVKLWRQGALRGAGQVSGNVDIAPGNNVGILNVDGDVTLAPTSTVQIEISGTSQVDQILTTGNVSLGGTLEVFFTGGFVPIESDSFRIIGGDSFSGVFDTVSFSGLPEGLSFDINMTDTSLFLGVPSSVADCDLDGDADCDTEDIDLLYQNFGTSTTAFDLDGSGIVDAGDIGPWLIGASDANEDGLAFVVGDSNFDGVVDSTDLGLLLNNFGETDLTYGAGNLNGDMAVDSTDLGLLLNNFGAASLLASVPEPSAGLALLMAAGSLLFYWRRGESHGCLGCSVSETKRNGI